MDRPFLHGVPEDIIISGGDHPPDAMVGLPPRAAMVDLPRRLTAGSQLRTGAEQKPCGSGLDRGEDELRESAARNAARARDERAEGFQ